MSDSVSTTSVPIGFMSLPEAIRSNIYQRVLSIPHPLYLFQDPGSPIETFAPEKPRRWLALLFTNRQISAEARAMLYRVNHFLLQEATQRQGRLLRSFLTAIGPTNAGCLSHLSIEFPATVKAEGTTDDGIKLREDGLQSLQLLQSACPNLKTLEALLFGQNARDLIDEDRIGSEAVRAVLREIDAQFRAIDSLNTIIVRVYSGPPSPLVREFLQGLGWVILVGDV